MTVKKYWPSTFRVQAEDADGLIGLPYPYSVSCINRQTIFQEMYYWGTYFTNTGLLRIGHLAQAKNNVDNMLYLVERFGYMPNANRTWALNRSQPPFLSQMVADVYAETGDKAWLRAAFDLLCREYDFWQTKRMTKSGLNRYFGEVLDVEYNVSRYCRRLKLPWPTKELEQEYAEAFLTGAESGWDSTSRCGVLGHHCNWVDLNALLYGVEQNMAYFAAELSLDASVWQTRAARRAERMRQLLWNEELGVFCGYDFEKGEQKTLLSMAMFYPMFVGMATETEAAKTVQAMKKLECPYGLSATEERADLMELQWDYPCNWPCKQYLAVRALLRYGYQKEAREIAKGNLDVMRLNFEKTGRLWEKYNAATGEITNTVDYDTPPLLGWSAATYLYFLDLVEGK